MYQHDDPTRPGVTAVDFFVPDLNFVFGEASSIERVTVFSIARLDPRFYEGLEDGAILPRRAVTAAAHELGHVFGLGHCTQLGKTRSQKQTGKEASSARAALVSLASREAEPSAFMLEELYGALVPFGLPARVECPQVFSLAGLRIFLSRIEPVLA